MSEATFSFRPSFRPYCHSFGLRWNFVNVICYKWLTEVTSRSEEVPADDLSSIDKADLPKYIENYATIVESNLEKAEMMRVDIPLPYFCTRSFKKELNTLRCRFEKACRGMHEHYTYSFDGEALVDIFYRLQETCIYIAELLKYIKNVTDFWEEFSSTTHFNRFLNCVWDPIIRNVKDSIFKLNESMQANLLKYYASSIMCDIISIIIALLLFICQSSLESATDMKQLMIFVTVIHLIISGDVESNPGPSFDARVDLLKKEPMVSDLQRIFTQSDAECHWKTIGIALEVKVNDLIVEPNSAADKLGSVFERWRQKYEDVTWERIIQVCEDYEFGRLRYAIFKFLSSHEAHSKYGSEPDFDCTFTGSRSVMVVHKESKENGYSTKTVHGLLIILITIIIVLCNIIYQMWTDVCQC